MGTVKKRHYTPKKINILKLKKFIEKLDLKKTNDIHSNG